VRETGGEPSKTKKVWAYGPYKDNSDGVPVCRVLELEETKGKGRCRKMKNDYMKIDVKRLGLIMEDALIRDMWRSLTSGIRPALQHSGKKGVVFDVLHSCDPKH